ncbi:uncharacterized protein LOC143275588 [Babylonia areolata]|uniref:uncharacterized protein LOC143275588 n=1 Tax=Babylonia areolata TaxID=304850 RepID=UPI003FD3C127
MSQAVPGAGAGDGATGELPLNQRPKLASPDFEGDDGMPGPCTLRYEYQTAKGDDCEWDIVTDPDSGGTYMFFQAKRKGSDGIVAINKSSVVPSDVNLKEILQVKSKKLHCKNGWYEVNLVKKKAFKLEPYFRPTRP